MADDEAKFLEESKDILGMSDEQLREVLVAQSQLVTDKMERPDLLKKYLNSNYPSLSKEARQAFHQVASKSKDEAFEQVSDTVKELVEQLDENEAKALILTILRSLPADSSNKKPAAKKPSPTVEDDSASTEDDAAASLEKRDNSKSSVASGDKKQAAPMDTSSAPKDRTEDGPPAAAAGGMKQAATMKDNMSGSAMQSNEIDLTTDDSMDADDSSDPVTDDEKFVLDMHETNLFDCTIPWIKKKLLPPKNKCNRPDCLAKYFAEKYPSASESTKKTFLDIDTMKVKELREALNLSKDNSSPAELKKRLFMTRCGQRQDESASQATAKAAPTKPPMDKSGDRAASAGKRSVAKVVSQVVSKISPRKRQARRAPQATARAATNTPVALAVSNVDKRRESTPRRQPVKPESGYSKKKPKRRSKAATKTATAKPPTMPTIPEDAAASSENALARTDNAMVRKRRDVKGVWTPISSGATAIVYSATLKKDGRLCAVKKCVVKNSRKWSKEKFKMEVDLLKKASCCPNVVNYYGSFLEKDGTGYIVMELLPMTLDDFITSSPYRCGEHKIAHIFKGVFDAVAYCHENKIIHRDVNIKNILYSPDTETVKLADFGVSKWDNEGGVHMSMVGTKEFMPMQVRSGSKEYTNLYDVYCMGVVLYFMNNRKLVGLEEAAEMKVQPGSIEYLIKGLLQENEDDRLKLEQIRDDLWLAGWLGDYVKF